MIIIDILFALLSVPFWILSFTVILAGLFGKITMDGIRIPYHPDLLYIRMLVVVIGLLFAAIGYALIVVI